MEHVIFIIGVASVSHRRPVCVRNYVFERFNIIFGIVSIGVMCRLFYRWGRGQVEKVDLLRYFWKIDLEKIYFFYFFDLYFCFLKAFFGLK